MNDKHWINRLCDNPYYGVVIGILAGTNLAGAIASSFWWMKLLNLALVVMLVEVTFKRHWLPTYVARREREKWPQEDLY